MTKQKTHINMTENSNLFVMNNILQHVIPSAIVYHNNILPPPEVHARTVTQPPVARTSSLHETVTHQHVASPAACANTYATTRCLSRDIRETVTQQHVAFASGTRKNSHATTRCLHKWKTQNNHATRRRLHRRYTQNNHATTCCLHQWYTQNQSRNNSLPSPVVNAKNSNATIRCLHQWYTQKTVTQQHVAYTGGKREKQ